MQKNSLGCRTLPRLAREQAWARTRRDLDDPEERAAALGELEALLFAAAGPLSLAEIARRLSLVEQQATELVDLLDRQLSRPRGAACSCAKRERGGSSKPRPIARISSPACTPNAERDRSPTRRWRRSR
jgi:hypothetical protein